MEMKMGFTEVGKESDLTLENNGYREEGSVGHRILDLELKRTLEII